MQVNNGRSNKSQKKVCCGGLSELLSPQLFKALADPKRLELLARVAEGGGASTVSGVAKGSGVDLSVVSRHLAILREAGIIRCEKQGKEVRCTLQTDAVVSVLRQLADALESCCPKGRMQDKPVNPTSQPARSIKASRRRS